MLDEFVLTELRVEGLSFCRNEEVVELEEEPVELVLSVLRLELLVEEVELDVLELTVLLEEVLPSTYVELDELSVTELVLLFCTVEWLLLFTVEELLLETTNSTAGMVLSVNSEYGVLPAGK